MYCSTCKSYMDDNAVFCKNCGTPSSPEQRAFSTMTPNPITAPLSLMDYVIMFLIQIIPIVNIVFLLIWAFSKNENLNRKNYARATLIWMLVGLAVSIIFFVTFMPMLRYGMMGGRFY